MNRISKEKAIRIGIIGGGVFLVIFLTLFLILLGAKGPNRTFKEFWASRQGTGLSKVFGGPPFKNSETLSFDGNDGNDGKNGIDGNSQWALQSALSQGMSNYEDEMGLTLSAEERELIMAQLLEYFKENNLVYTEQDLENSQLIGSDEIDQIVYSDQLKEFLESFITSYISTKYSILDYLTEESIITGEQYDMDAITSYVASALIKNKQFLTTVANAVGAGGNGGGGNTQEQLNSLKSQIMTAAADAKKAQGDIDKYKSTNDKAMEDLEKKINGDIGNKLDNLKKDFDKTKKDTDDAIKALQDKLNKDVGDAIAGLTKDLDDAKKDLLGKIGDTTQLKTTDKTSIVNSVNEVYDNTTNNKTEITNLYDNNVIGAEYIPSGDPDTGGTLKLTIIDPKKSTDYKTPAAAGAGGAGGAGDGGAGGGTPYSPPGDGGGAGDGGAGGTP